MKTRSGSSQIVFSKIRADQSDEGFKIEFKPNPIWEPYVEAVLARQRQELSDLASHHTF